ncbi:xrn-2 [Symbiodinium pilosum]|uniref:Xrn-2 protein n=1 Tax=Symbiodinium pilosum TaxID=2952 RepID=A0A812JDK3_SYMPI|nr:xrn-2 [Symbiodinium pilosum]
MGVPGFYRWAVRRVPHLRAKTSGPPYEFDNLYLDFNGVVHTCVNDWTLQEQEEYLFQLIEAQLAVLLSLVTPKVLLYIALDGVAPRAKMNQQRSRRFRKAQETEADGIDAVIDVFDRNAITPGTPFMQRLSDRLRSWAATQAAAPDLQGLSIVISCDRDPGEGEHKIMDVIRHHPEHTHCLCSNDADLVFLGLVCESEHVYLLRTKPNYEKRVRTDTGQSQAPETQAAVDSDGAAPVPEPAATAGPMAEDYEMLSIVALRSWLCSQFPDCAPNRLLADFVAMCCLVGNDFLPHIAAVEIYDGGLDKLLAAYCKLKTASSGYLTTEDLTLNLPRWRGLLEQVAQEEAEILLDMVGLGWGPQQLPYRGPGPVGPNWDGVSVVVSPVPRKTTAGQLSAAMSKQGCTVQSVHQLKQSRGPASWLVRFADPASAVRTLVSTRRIETQRLQVSWAQLNRLQFEETPPEPAEASNWQQELHRAVRESFEYWLGPENLPNDAFLRRHVRQRRDRFVPLRVFVMFRRLRVWMQDQAQLAEVLRSSDQLEVWGEGRHAWVRHKEDHSRRPHESHDQVERQMACLELLAARQCVEAVQMLRPEYYARYPGPVAAGSPAAEDVAAVERHRSVAFLSGIEWVLHYYVRGCRSWSWFYPAHYPPLCAGLAMVQGPLPVPPLDEPVAPELQLLAVLPPQSSPLLPPRLRPLLEDTSSQIADFYPREFETDLKEGDKEWQAIVLLPFVEEKRLRQALFSVLQESDLSQSQQAKAFVAEDAILRSWSFSAEKPLPESRASRDPDGVPVQFAEAAAAILLLATETARKGGKGMPGGKGRGKRGQNGKGAAVKDLKEAPGHGEDALVPVTDKMPAASNSEATSLSAVTALLSRNCCSERQCSIA